jgi:hypothetical protein
MALDLLCLFRLVFFGQKWVASSGIWHCFGSRYPAEVEAMQLAASSEHGRFKRDSTVTVTVALDAGSCAVSCAALVLPIAAVLTRSSSYL